MDTTISGALVSAQVSSAAGMSVLKKANEADGDTAMQLVDASSSNLPPHLGNNIDTVA